MKLYFVLALTLLSAPSYAQSPLVGTWVGAGSDEKGTPCQFKISLDETSSVQLTIREDLDCGFNATQRHTVQNFARQGSALVAAEDGFCGSLNSTALELNYECPTGQFETGSATETMRLLHNGLLQYRSADPSGIFPDQLSGSLQRQ